MQLVETPNFSLDTYSKGDSDAERLALVLPGFLDTKDQPFIRGHVDYLSKQGYLAVSFDPPGTWGSGDDIAEYTVTNYLAAIAELSAHFADRPAFVMGHSMGGRMALLAAMRGDNIRSVAAIMSIFEYIRPANRESRTTRWQAAGVRTFTNASANGGRGASFDLPYSYSQDAQRYNSPEGLRRLAIPKLFIIGRQDSVITPDEARTTYDIAAEPKELRELESGHFYGRRPDMVDKVNGLVKDFLTRHDQL